MEDTILNLKKQFSLFYALSNLVDKNLTVVKQSASCFLLFANILSNISLMMQMSTFNTSFF